MAIKLRDDSKIPVKVMFLGKDGTGKSTNAYKFAVGRGMKPIAIDFDDTNINTGCPVMDIDLSSHIIAKKNIIQAIRDVEKDPDYDCLIFDNAGSMVDYITADPEKDPYNKAGTGAFKAIMKTLRKSRLNVIFIGQVDFYVEEPGPNKTEKNNKKAISINAWVNERYYCWRTGDNPSEYQYHCVRDKDREGNKDG